MPTDGPWPPKAHAPAYAAYRDWDAWYAGDADGLRQVYANRGSYGASLPPSQRRFPGQAAGGVIGRFSRWLWGNPPSTTARDTRLHVPIAADLAVIGANLLFSEPPKISATDTAVMQRIEKLVEDGFTRTLLHAKEASAVLGDVYLTPVIDQDVAPKQAIVAVHHADAAIPVIRWGKLVEVTFWSELERDNNRVVRWLEHHDVDRSNPAKPVGRITYAVFEGSITDLGRRVDLKGFDATRHLADLVDSAGVQPTGIDRLDVVRFPNRGPQRLWRSDANLKHLGRSDFDSNEPIFDQIDEVWTSWLRDIRLAKGRLTVPESYLQSHGPGQGASFDAEREVYSAVNALPQDMTGGGITLSQFAIRHVEHKATIDALMEVATRHAGYSQQTMGEEGDTPMTATEAQARERLSFTTRASDGQIWRPSIAEYVEVHLAIEAAAFAGPAPVRPDVELADSVTESPETVARTAQLLTAAMAASTETLVRMVHPDWDDTQVAKEVAAIQGATAATPEESLGGLAGNTPPGEPPPAAEGEEAAAAEGEPPVEE
ncbi:hypothetical protein GCM10009557_06000 [Virgisporangium ochraceum]